MNSESLTIGIVSPSSIYLLGGGAFGRVCLRILISRLRTLEMVQYIKILTFVNEILSFEIETHKQR